MRTLETRPLETLANIISRIGKQKFMREGCPNCDSVLGLRGNNDAIQECTSQVFEGLITLNDPNTSWVARWQRLDSYVPGTYAVKVTGSVSAMLLSLAR